MEHSAVMKNRTPSPLISTPLTYSPSNTESTLSSLETKHLNSHWKQPTKGIDPSISLVCKDIEALISNSLSGSRSNKRTEPLVLEQKPVKRHALLTPKNNEPVKPPIYIEDSLNKLLIKAHLDSNEEDIIARSYGQIISRNSSLEEESKQKQTDDERSLLSSSAFNDSPRIYHYSESSVNESPGIDSPMAESGPIIFSDKREEIKLATIGEMSFGKNLSMESISKLAGGNVEVVQMQVQHLSSIVERLEGEVQRRFQTMQSDMLTFSEQLSQNKVEFAGLKHFRQIEDTTLRNFEQRITKNEQASNDSYKILEEILREISDRIELFEKKEEGKIKLFEEIGYDIESVREDYKALTIKLDTIQKEFIEKIDFLKHEIVTPSQIELLTSAHRKEISVIWNEIGKYNVKMNSQCEDLDRIRSQQYDTQINIIKKDLDSLRGSLNLKYDSFPGMIEERLRESYKQMQELHNKIDKLEASELLESEASTVRAYKSFEARLNQIESKAIKVSQHDLSETQKLLKKENTIISKLDDRVSELEKETKLMKNLKKKLAYMIRNLSSTEKNTDLPLSMTDLRKKPLITNPSTLIHQETTPEEEEVTPDPHSFASTPVYRSAVKSSSKILEEDYQDSGYRLNSQQVLLTQSDSQPTFEDRLSYIEKINIHKKAMDSITSKSPIQAVHIPSNIDAGKIQLDLRGYLPGEAESVVLSAILGKANQTRAAENLRVSYGNSFKPLSPLSSSFNNPAKYSEKAHFTSPTPSKLRDQTQSGPSLFQPSDELREHLKLKGFKIKDNKPILRY